MAGSASTIEKPVLSYDRSGYDDDELIRLYRAILKPRMIEEKMLTQLRRGKISKWFAGIGQEATTVGSAAVMRDDEYMLTMHRNLGAFTTRGVPLHRLMAQFQGKEAGFTKGRDRSFHLGSQEYRIVGMISHLGAQLGVADGLGLAADLKGEEKAVLAFTGEGATSEGDFHEAVNVAAVWDLPVIFVIENNYYGLSTPISEQYKCERLADKGVGYGMEAIRIDGNNILTVHRTLNDVAERARKEHKPVLVECMTFRMRGHEEASGTKYVPDELMEEWGQKDPVTNFELFLQAEGVLDPEGIDAIRQEFADTIDQEVKQGDKEPHVESDRARELGDVYAPGPAYPDGGSTGERRDIRYVDAVSEGLWESMRVHENLILMGQDIAEYGGVFKVTEGFLEEFGQERVRNTPLCESAIVGTALGLSIEGFKSMVEMQFADFITCGFNQTVNNLAKSHYRWEQAADVVIRMPTGGGIGAAPFHSQSTEAWFTHTPGLKVVYPAFPDDAKGLMLSAFHDPNPVLYFEHKMLYRSVRGEVPEGVEYTPIGVARNVREGNTVSIITYGAGVHWALEAVEEMEADVEVIDLRTLVPLDEKAVLDSVKKTGKALILHEAVRTGGFGGELSARISEAAFEYLDGPVKRVAALDTPVPFAGPLESDFLPKERLREKLQELLEY